MLAAALVLPGMLSACFGLSTRPADFRARPDSVAPGSLRGPFRGRVVDATGAPVSGAVVYATWTLRSGYGMTLPAGHREHLTSTDERGVYEVPALAEPRGGARVTDFALVIYKRGFVAYRSDRRFSDLGPRRDFAQVGNEVVLERWRDELSHVRHLRYVGGGPALAALTVWEAEEAAAELATAGEPAAIASPLLVRPGAARLVASRLLGAEEVKAVTGFDGDFETGPLDDEPDTESYSSQHLEAMGLPESYDVALRVWRESAEGAEQRYVGLLDGLPGARELDDLADRSLRAVEGDIFGVAFLDRARGVVVLLTCGQSQCATQDVAARLAEGVLERLRAQVTPIAPASPAPDPAAPTPDPATPAPAAPDPAAPAPAPPVQGDPR